MKHYKYPKTFHFDWSPGLQNDDRLLKSTDTFIGKEVVATVKLDGENTSMYSDYIHARSLDSVFHKSRTWVSKLHGEIGYLLKENERICGENIAALHSIPYEGMKSFFYVFSIWEDEKCLSWDDTIKRCKELGLIHVPVLYRGIYDEDIIKKLYSSTLEGNEMEGYVVRLTESYQMKDFQSSVAKFVRKNHIQSDKNWMLKPVIWNGWKNGL